MEDSDKNIQVNNDGMEIIHLKPGDNVSVNGISYDDAIIDVVGTDIILTSPATNAKAIFPGLGLILFDENQSPDIILNGQSITAKMFADKIGMVSNVTKSDYITFTSLDVSEEKPEEQKSLADEETSEVIEELEEENQALQQQVQQITETNEEAELLLASLSSENAQLQASSAEADKPPKPEPREFQEVTSGGIPPVEENFFTSNDDAISSSTSSAVDIASETETETETSTVSGSVTNFSFKAFLLQPAANESSEDVMGTPTFIVQGGGGNADSTFNPANSIQLSSEVLNYASRTDDIIVYADNGELFNDNELTRAIEITPTLPDGFTVTSATISGLPAGFEVIGGTPEGDGFAIDLSDTEASSRGNIQFDLKYPIPATLDFEMEIAVTATFDPESGIPAPEVSEQIFVLTQLVEQKDVANADDLNYEDGEGNLVWVLTNQANENTILSGSGDDMLYGSNGFDTIQAGAGNDTINGGDGDDVIDAQEGDDTITGGGGNDTITGGTGTNNVDYTGRDENINLDMRVTDGDGYSTVTIGDNGEFDLIRQIQNITGGEGNDVIIGSDAANILIGGSGDDVLDGALGDDTIDGGEGNDTISFISGDSGLSVNLGTGGTINVGTGAKTILNIESITATDYVDTITATGGDNVINGAGEGDLFITDGSGNDIFDGGFNGVDTNGSDRIDYSTSANGITVDLSGAADADGFYAVTVGATTDLIKGIEIIYGSNTAADAITGTGSGIYYGQGGNDTITGGAGKNTIDGGDGDDALNGGGGDDTIIPGIGADILDGGNGTDTLFYLGTVPNTGSTFTLTTPTSGTLVLGGETDTFVNFELFDLTFGADIIYTSSGNDVINGRAGSDIFYASEGSDTFDGGANTDTIDYTTRGNGVYLEVNLSAAPNLTVDVHDSGTNALIEQDIINNIENIIGSAGDDYFIDGNDNNVIDGGSGSDTFSYQNDSTGISFDMNITSSGYFTITQGGESDQIRSIENIIGSTGDDIMTGDIAANNFDGNSGADIFFASAGGDTYTGGDGIDRINYYQLTGLNSINVNLTSGTATLDFGAIGADADDTTDIYLDDFEEIGATDGNDTVIGNAENNTIYDEGGDDVFDGGGGINTIDYGRLDGNGVNVDLTAGTADDDLGAGVVDSLSNFTHVVGSNQGDTITGDAQNNALTGREGNDFLYGLDGNDKLSGNNGKDTIYGGTGDDIITGENNNDSLYGNAGNDSIDGGDGTDRVYYNDNATGVTVDLQSGKATDNYGDMDTLSRIEELTTSSGDDTITASGSTIDIVAGGGDDVITSNIQLQSGRVLSISAGTTGETNGDVIDYSSAGSLSGTITGTTATISSGGSTDIISNAERFKLSDSGDSFTINTDAIVNNLSEVDGNNGDDSVNVTTGGAGDLTGADIDGDTLASLFTDIEELDFRNTSISDSFDISDTDVTNITGGGNSLTILIDGIDVTFGDFNYLSGSGIDNVDVDPDPNTQLVQWNSGAELTVAIA